MEDKVNRRQADGHDLAIVHSPEGARLLETDEQREERTSLLELSRNIVQTRAESTDAKLRAIVKLA